MFARLREKGSSLPCSYGHGAQESCRYRCRLSITRQNVEPVEDNEVTRIDTKIAVTASRTMHVLFYNSSYTAAITEYKRLPYQAEENSLQFTTYCRVCWNAGRHPRCRIHCAYAGGPVGEIPTTKAPASNIHILVEKEASRSVLGNGYVEFMLGYLVALGSDMGGVIFEKKKRGSGLLCVRLAGPPVSPSRPFACPCRIFGVDL